MDAPGTRYKVVERGRRLEVIDTWNHNAPVSEMRDPGSPAVRADDAVSAARAMGASRPIAGSARSFQTSPWYDEKGLRTVPLTAQGEAKLKGLRLMALILLFAAVVIAFISWPILLVLPFVLVNAQTRKQLRAAGTKFIDGINQPGG